MARHDANDSTLKYEMSPTVFSLGIIWGCIGNQGISIASFTINSSLFHNAGKCLRYVVHTLFIMKAKLIDIYLVNYSITSAVGMRYVEKEVGLLSALGISSVRGHVALRPTLSPTNGR